MKLESEIRVKKNQAGDAKKTFTVLAGALLTMSAYVLFQRVYLLRELLLAVACAAILVFFAANLAVIGILFHAAARSIWQSIGKATPRIAQPDKAHAEEHLGPLLVSPTISYSVRWFLDTCAYLNPLAGRTERGGGAIGHGPVKWSMQMIRKETKKILTVTLSFVLLSAAYQILCVYGYQTAGSSTTGEGSGGTEGAPMSTNELQSLVAPIALYPDSLVAQILTASTFPDQVAIANYWLEQNKNLTGSALMQAVDKQSWDPSVKALTQFPSVLDNLAKNLTWTSSLGEAYHNQQSEVMTAIQTLRAQAQSKGNLKSSSQITVVQQSPQTIVIQPANPQIVYVPQYNPAVIYGTPYVVPGYVAPAYSAGDVAAAGIIGFGAGIAVGAMMSGGCCSWGYSSWNCGWHGTAVVYHGGGYYGNAGWHGGYYNGGYHSSYGYNNSFNRNFNNNYNRNYNSNVNKNVNVNNNFNRSNFNNDSSAHSDSWAHNDSGKSSAFSGWSGSHSSDGWSSRADSSRGWGSMHSSGFGGGRFGGGGSGGGGFGGFRR